jgi:hypothetical protein
MIRTVVSLGILTLVAVSATACGTQEQSVVKFASDFKPGGHAVSVLGVYKDGQMSADAWGGLAPRVEQAFGASTCEIGYGAALASTNGALSAAIDEYSRSNGPTDDLLAQLAPAAGGDLIMVLIVAGKLPTQNEASVTDPQAQRSGTSLKAGAADLHRKKEAVDPDVLQLSASLYSVAQRRSVALVDVKYRGENADKATAKLAAQLSQSLPGAVCRGWTWNDKVDPERIRKLIDE